MRDGEYPHASPGCEQVEKRHQDTDADASAIDQDRERYDESGKAQMWETQVSHSSPSDMRGDRRLGGAGKRDLWHSIGIDARHRETLRDLETGPLFT